MTTVKICGLTDEQAVRTLIISGAGYAGFVYFPQSPRHREIEVAASLRSLLPPSIRAVSVVVDPDDTLLKSIASEIRPDYFQLHGHEAPERVHEIRQTFPHIKIIKAIRIRASDDIAKAMQYSHSADMLMFDAKPPESAGFLPGGNGLSFDWALLKNRDFTMPWMLSGGLNIGNVTEAIGQTGATMVDVSSGVESAPGVKDPELIKLFVTAVQRYDAKFKV